jgi:hypothetical protein
MAGDTGQPVSDEALRLVALRAIFTGMQVSIEPGKRIDDSGPKKPKPGEMFVPDAFANENVYRVVGAAKNEAEKWASEDIATQKLSNTRQVRFRLFHWPKEGDAGLLAVLQYDFLGASPAMSCPSIGLLVHLARNAANWDVREQYLLDTTHHFSLQRAELLDLTGEGADELVVESDSGGAGTFLTTLHVFALGGGRFEEELDTLSRLQYMERDNYTQVLDVNRTRQHRGVEFCFFENGAL